MFDAKPIKVTSSSEMSYSGPDPQPFETVGPIETQGVVFDLAPEDTDIPVGTMHWDPALNTVEVYRGNTRLSIGFEEYMPVRNNSGSTILNGSPIQITGQIGNKSTIALDNGQGLCAGVATYDIPNNTFGEVTTFGYVNDLDTQGYTAGQPVFANGSGGLTTSFTASFVGFIGNVHPNQGSILVRPASFRNPSGTTANRTTVRPVGFMYFDTTLG